MYLPLLRVILTGFLFLNTVFYSGVQTQANSGSIADSQRCGYQRDVKFCFLEGSSDSKRLIVYLHGFGRHHRSWNRNEINKQILRTWDRLGDHRPHMITLSLGRNWWYSSPQYGNALTYRLDVLRRAFAPQTDEVFLYGDSMGGHNALRWAIDHPRYFKKVALLCPAIPLSFVGLSSTYTGSTPLVLLAERLFRSVYPDHRYRNFEAAFDLDRLRPVSQMFVALSSIDDFGFYPGNHRLTTELRSVLGRDKVVVDHQRVSHCYVNTRSLARFLFL